MPASAPTSPGYYRHYRYRRHVHIPWKPFNHSQDANLAICSQRLIENCLQAHPFVSGPCCRATGHMRHSLLLLAGEHALSTLLSMVSDSPKKSLHMSMLMLCQRVASPTHLSQQGARAVNVSQSALIPSLSRLTRRHSTQINVCALQALKLRTCRPWCSMQQQ